MKKLSLLIIFFSCAIVFSSKAQIYSMGYTGFSGVGIIYYPYGYYQGQIYNGFANGTGTFYWTDGSFYYGGFTGGFYNGAGVLVTRLYGYISGCWFNGSFAGMCQSTYNPYSQNTVENLVTQVQQNKPQNTTSSQYQSYDPDGYKVTKIDPNTEMGTTLLGSYK